MTYKICNKCVMDTSDSNITFDSNGICDHCNDFEKNVRQRNILNNVQKLIARKDFSLSRK